MIIKSKERIESLPTVYVPACSPLLALVSETTNLLKEKEETPEEVGLLPLKETPKIIKTNLGEIEIDDTDPSTAAEAKAQIYSEINHNDDGRIKEAQRKLLRRLNKEDKTEAWTWSQYYRDLVGTEDG